MDSIRIIILQKIFTQCAKMLDPKPNTPYAKRSAADYANPETNSEYNRVFDGGSRLDFRILPPEGQELQVITRYINSIRFGTGRIADYYRRGLLPALFIEEATDSYAGDYPGIELAKVGEIYPVKLRFAMVEQKPNERTMPEYRYSNPIYMGQMKEQLDYLLDRNEFTGISVPRIGYDLPSKVYDAGVGTSQNLEGVKAPFEIVDVRFEVIFDKEKEISNRYVE